MATPKNIPIQGFSEMLLYKTASGNIKVEIFVKDENLWLTQQKIADLFAVQRPAITKHLKNIFESGELQEDVVSSILEHTTAHGAIEGKMQLSQTKYYNIDAIISVGYRVNSTQATHFRIWATERLKEYIIKGFTMDDEKLKNPNNPFGNDYFEEQLARIRDIRSSERRFYQKITDIYAQCSADYNADNETTRQFFATVQNKLHWAITKQTAAEIIYTRANSNKKNMGLTTFKNAPTDSIRKQDISVAKNYLQPNELDQLNRIVTLYLDYADLQAKKGRIMYMKDWVQKLNSFLQFNEMDILQDNGKISHQIAFSLAEKEFEKYNAQKLANYVSDFDNAIAENTTNPSIPKTKKA